ncbi:MAG: sulfide-dependent adenosine diphosphate thiazole synthase [Elusimicrobiota bacterium]
MLDEIKVTRSIIKKSVDDLLDNLDADVIIGGGGPAGILAGALLAEKGRKTVLFERKLSLGGGMWGGGMMFPRIVVQEDAADILDIFGIGYHREGDLLNASSIETVSKLIAGACDRGCKMFNLISIEDVMIRKDKVSGAVINWTSVESAGLHVDPVSVKSGALIEATGHPLEICRVVEEKVGKLNTPTGKIMGERSMWAHEAEKIVVENTRQIYPGLYVCGMAANAAYGAPRMGPVFGGMLKSGRKVAELVHKDLG